MRDHSYVSVFSQFPIEVVDEIAKYVAVRELKVLCLVSRQTGNVATRRMYHTILLNGLKGSVGCLRTLATKRDVARCVRKLTILSPTFFMGAFFSGAPRNYTLLCICFYATGNQTYFFGVNKSRQLPSRKLLLGNFYRLAVDALGQMDNLTGLDISDMGRHFTSLLVDVPFPRLVELKIPYTSRLVDFLRTHGRNLRVVIVQSGITDSGFGSPSTRLLSKTSTFERIEMPELMGYIGPCDIIPYIVPGSQVQYLTVSWDSGLSRSEVERIMQSGKMSKKKIIGMDNLVVGWSPHLLGCIAENVPSIERLRLRVVCPAMNKAGVDECLFSIVENLEKMKCLQTLSLMVLFQTYTYRLEDLDGEHVFIKRLGTSIPTLSICTLPSTTRWKRFKEQYWFPIIDGMSDAFKGMKIHWFFKAFADGTYPTELFSEVCGLEYEGLEDLMPLRLLWDEEADGDETTDEEDEAGNEDGDGTFDNDGEEEALGD